MRQLELLKPAKEGETAQAMWKGLKPCEAMWKGLKPYEAMWKRLKPCEDVSAKTLRRFRHMSDTCMHVIGQTLRCFRHVVASLQDVSVGCFGNFDQFLASFAISPFIDVLSSCFITTTNDCGIQLKG
ncbi:hypothetical protein HanRHA438_Chr07g0298731 [Helianthus annuus]|nr:hypothetical protein HanRHA438_Chr07g0298731 [Helianthus annuus]